MLFFSAEPLTLFTYPAYMHRSEVQTHLAYVPAAYDISKWLRPLQGTFEIPEATTTVRVCEDDPLYYVRFNTTKRVRLRRFQTVPEIQAIAHGYSNQGRRSNEFMRLSRAQSKTNVY
jgi:hypothetical protein